MTDVRIHIFCEGQTEEKFVSEILYFHFLPKGIYVSPVVVTTGKQSKAGGKYRGGGKSYGKIQHQINIKCKEDPKAYVTTMLDYYGLYKDFPNIADKTKKKDLYDRVAFLEKSFEKDIGHKNFIANLLLHEFEGLLFSDPVEMASWFDDDDLADKLKAERGIQSPEHINDNSATAPSKRILRHCKQYDKIVHGYCIAEDIGLDTIRRECKHFDAWLTRLEGLAKERK
ncbi:MAG: DUF4276 family protein [bacterium]|nr:DUF4276 family protein [bacterium]